MTRSQKEAQRLNRFKGDKFLLGTQSAGSPASHSLKGRSLLAPTVAPRSQGSLLPR